MSTLGEIVATYDYRDMDGALLYQAVRYEPKTFRQRRPDGRGGWIWSLGDTRRVIYRLPDLVGKEAVLVLEGEKDCNAAWALGLPATCNVAGASRSQDQPKWHDEYTQQLIAAGVKRVVIGNDHDEPGFVHADRIAKSCHAHGLTTKRLILPGLAAGGDLSDYLAAGHTKDDLVGLLKAAPLYDPQAPLDIPDSAIKRKDKTVEPSTAFEPSALLTCMADVQIEPIDWLWSNRLARAKMSMLVGDPGIGKSSITYDIAARLTSGVAFPDGEPTTPASVIFLAAEDGLADTMKPGLQACGAEMSRVFVLEAVKVGEAEDAQRTFSLDADIPILEQAIARTGATLVVIDPITSYLGSVDSYKDPDVRRVLMPLVKLARRTRVSVLCLMHLTKEAKAKALNRTMGSMAFVAVPRIVMAVGPDPTDPNPYAMGANRALVSIKQNICAPAIPWDYRITGQPHRIEWGGPREDLSPDQVVAGVPYRDAEERQDVESFLRTHLADGAWHPQAEIEAAATAAGITKPRLRRTREKVCDTKKIGFTGKWYWQLKSPAAPEDVTSEAAGTKNCDAPTTGDIFGEGNDVSALDAMAFPKMTGDDIFGGNQPPLSSSVTPSDLGPEWKKVV